MPSINSLNTTGNTEMNNAIPEVWSPQLLVEAEKKSFWNVYEGPQGSGMPIIRKDDLTKTPGDTIHVQTMSNLTGTGVTGTSTLAGNEEKLSLGQISLSPTQYRHAVAMEKTTQQVVNFDMRMAAMNRLAYWLADKLDVLTFTEMSNGATYNQFAGNATSSGTLNSGDELDVSELAKMYTMLESNRALPIRLEGGHALYCAVISPEDAYYLRQDTSTLNWTNIQQYANARGELNPVFTGALGVIGGMIVKVSHNVETTGSGASRTSKIIGFGGEAGVTGYIQYPDWTEQVEDYGQQFGVATSVVFDVERGVEENSLVLEAFSPEVTD